jgi:nucleoside-diphosphate-sugar epimerase
VSGAPINYTVFGANGFIGSAIVARLLAEGHQVRAVTRGGWPERGADLGHVIFTIGMTADFRTRLVETVESQVIRLHEALTWYRYASFLGLSSARVYAGVTATGEETPLLVRPTDPDHIYNIAKLTGESLCLAIDNPAVRVVRLSNVYGAADRSNLFLTAVLRDAVRIGVVEIGQSPDSSKDYIAVEDAARLIISISRSGQHRLYNVAYGSNLTHRRIANVLMEESVKVSFRPGGAVASVAPIDTQRLDTEFAWVREAPEQGLRRVLAALRTTGLDTP